MTLKAYNIQHTQLNTPRVIPRALIHKLVPVAVLDFVTNNQQIDINYNFFIIML